VFHLSLVHTSMAEEVVRNASHVQVEKQSLLSQERFLEVLFPIYVRIQYHIRHGSIPHRRCSCCPSSTVDGMKLCFGLQLYEISVILLGNGKAVSLAKSCMLADPDSILHPTPPSYAASGLTFRAINGWHHDANRDSPSRAASASAFLPLPRWRISRLFVGEWPSVRHRI
jgi:hypothetical protein